MPHNADPMLGVYRNVTKPVTDLLTLLLEGAERLQHAQLTAIQQLLANQSSMDRQLIDASNIHEAVDIQGKAGRENWTKTMTALTEIYTAGSVNQMEWIRQTQAHALQFIDDIESRLEELPKEAAPMMNSVKLLISATRATFTANIRATEEAAKLATTRLENVLADAPVVASKRQAA